MNSAVTETNIPELGAPKRGKVRDIYDLEDQLLIVTSDRISAFDVVMPEPIPDKGIILNQIALFWFAATADIVAHHVVSADPDQYPAVCRSYADVLSGRSMLVSKTDPLPIECVVRGYLSGSGWKSYQKEGQVCGITLPGGLKESDKLPEPIFTPSTKEEVGVHDINISFEDACGILGRDVAGKVRDLSLALYQKGAEMALEKGIVIADTKFEFGLLNGDIVLIDEVLTPDSSRFWPRDNYRPGGPQLSFDKQFLRDYLIAIQWDQKPPAPHLPEDVIQNTRAKYIEALSLITGHTHGL